MSDQFAGARLAIIASKLLWADPEGVKARGGFGRQIEAISQHFAQTVIVAPFETRPDLVPGYLVTIRKLEVVQLPSYTGVNVRGKLDFLLKAPLICWRIRRVQSNSDVVHYRIPGYVGALGLLMHRIGRRKPAFVWLAGDWPERIRASHGNWYGRTMAVVARIATQWLIRGIPTFAVGRHLADEHGRGNRFVHQTVTTTVVSNDIVDVPRPHMSDPVKVLFVGRLDAPKGIQYLVEAIGLARQEGIRVELTIVGEGPEGVRLNEMVDRIGVTRNVALTGFVPFGGELWQIYRSADIFVMPSLSEGQPKVLVEAMASGLAVVATRVGGVPSIIEDGVNGLLVEPRSPEAILLAVGRIIRDPVLRRRLTTRGLETARKYTLDEQTDLMIDRLARDLGLLNQV